MDIGCFHVSIVVKNAAVNMQVQASLEDHD